MAEHSRSSGVFSRRLAVVNGGCCRPPARPRRYPVQSSLRRDPHTGVCVCKSGALPKKLAPTAPRHPPAAYAAETTTSLSPCSLSARQKSLSVQVWSGTGVHLANFFFCTTICIVCRSTYYYYYYCRTIISPFFATVKNGRSANYFFLSS